MITSLSLAFLLHQQPRFEPTWESLKQFQAPKWFRDAKFGIWAHWGPQSVPMAGDWYARNMYLEGTDQYKHHLANYGHPSEHGYVEIIQRWKAQNWDPESLMKLYKKSGARYFVSMGVHHDNFDLWNSKHHSWNATQHGPKRDVVGEWQRAAKRNGLPFGVSEHLGASFTWWRGSKGSDKTGPYAGVPYDGNNKALADLYHPLPAADDNAWYSKNAEWHKEWERRIDDLLTQYKPDLLYSDGGVPFGETGRRIVAKLYNQKNPTVYATKDIGSGDFVAGTCVLDRERGGMADIQALPWQTDTSIGDWFYNKGWGYRKPDWVIHTLVDVVSKNGNLLLNVVQRPDGSLDPEVTTLLDEVGEWLKVNGEGIYGTRPWKTFGEGPTKVAGGHFREDFPFGARDIRYTTKGTKTLYATFLGWTSETSVSLRSLARFPGVTASIKSVRLLGSPAKIAFQQTADALVVQLPKQPSGKYAFTLKLECSDVNGFRPDLVPPPPVPTVIVNSASTELGLDLAETKGKVQIETRPSGRNIGMWDDANDTITWTLDVKTPGRYRLQFEAAALARTSLTVVSGIRSIPVEIGSTTGWDDYRPWVAGDFELAAGTHKLVLQPSKSSWHPMNLRNARLVAAP
ncbi:MAG: alpha-L-fucosidase [Fimbriimonas sp.]